MFHPANLKGIYLIYKEEKSEEDKYEPKFSGIANRVGQEVS